VLVSLPLRKWLSSLNRALSTRNGYVFVYMREQPFLLRTCKSARWWCEAVAGLMLPMIAWQPHCYAGESASAASPLPLSLGPASAGQSSSGSGAQSGTTATISTLAADPQQRQAVRRAVLALADQEPFLDMVAAALQQTGYKL
jgi:hypothetical protein